MARFGGFSDIVVARSGGFSDIVVARSGGFSDIVVARSDGFRGDCRIRVCFSPVLFVRAYRV